jgi:hypothetical protein
VPSWVNAVAAGIVPSFCVLYSNENGMGMERELNWEIEMTAGGRSFRKQE